jgi:lysophospholipase L1-like esterase
MRLVLRVVLASATSLFLITAAVPLASARTAPTPLKDQRSHQVTRPRASHDRPASLTGENILVYGPAGTGGYEESVPGATYTIWDATQWASATTADFQAFNAIVFEDPSCGTPDWSTAISNESTWAPAVTGNVFINGTDPNFHGMNLLPQDGVTYAATGTGTGLYVSLSCTTDYTSAQQLLAPFGNFTVADPGDCGSTVHVVWSDPALVDLTDNYLSNWDCSVHEGFTAFPSNYHVFAIDTTSTDPWWTAPDGTQGMPYILVSGTGHLPSPAYIALGDSYSSGEGDGNYLTGTDTSTDHCHRSTLAYPELLDQDLSLGSLDFVSCSGAITDDYFNANNEGNQEPAQSQALTSDTQYVTLTFGGNDVGFSDVLAKCIYGKYGPVVVHAANCAKDTALKATVAKRLQALAGTATASTPKGVQIHSIASVLQSVHQLAPNATVYVADYPLLFGTSFSTDCGVGTVRATHVPVLGHVKVALKLNRAEITWLNSVGTSLANVIQTAAAANGATFVDASPDFDSHRFCDTSNAWFNPVSGTYNDKTGQLNVSSGSFHPTPDGQQFGYEAAFSFAGL